MSAVIPTSNQLLTVPSESLKTLVETALLISLVRPGTLREPFRPVVEGTWTRAAVAWRRFIDAFVLLADYRKGGASVSALSGVIISGRPTLLLASNYGVKQKVLDHLRYVLKALQDWETLRTDNHATIFEGLLNSSIQLCYDKVRNYKRKLARWMGKALGNPQSSSLNESLKRTRQYPSTTDHHGALCEWAYEFSKSHEFHYLKKKCSESSKLKVYRQIRHYIGRLGSWHRATLALVRIAADHPSLLNGLTIKPVRQQLTAWQPSGAGIDLPHLIEMLNLDLSNDHVMNKLESLYETVDRKTKDQYDNIQEEFRRRITGRNFKPNVHAEILLADYIHASKLDFMNDIRHIGCSKPSCVLCHIYLEAHPTRILPLPCHGNLWPKWSPPLFVSASMKQHNAELTRHTLERFQPLIKNFLMNGKIRSQRLPESITGITMTSRG